MDSHVYKPAAHLGAFIPPPSIRNNDNSDRNIPIYIIATSIGTCSVIILCSDSPLHSHVSFVLRSPGRRSDQENVKTQNNTAYEVVLRREYPEYELTEHHNRCNIERVN